MTIDLAAHRAALENDGYVIIERLMPAEAVAEARAAVSPHLGVYGCGRNQFEGFRTERVYTLPAISRAFDPFLAHPAVLSLVKPLLWGDCLLTAALAASLLPGEQPQAFHTDDAFYPLPRPRPAISIGAIWAIDAFTADNGATQLIPGSHRWGDDRTPRGVLDVADAFVTAEPDRRDGWADPEGDTVIAAEMPAGSVLVFLGTLWHRAGGNRTDRPRLGLFPQYCAAWARQQENFGLGVPKRTVAEMTPDMQALLGYAIHPPFMGHVGGRHPAKLLPAARSAGQLDVTNSPSNSTATIASRM